MEENLLCSRMETNTPEKAAQEAIHGRGLKVMKCPKHNSLIINLFCQTCNMLVCPKCLTLEHQQHIMCEVEITHLEKQDILRENYSTINNNLVPYFKEETRRLERLLQSHKDHFEMMTQKLVMQEAAFIREIRERIERMKESLVRALQEATSEIETRQAHLDKVISELKQKSELINRMIKSDNIIDICREADDVVKYVSCTDITSKPLPRSNFNFRPEEIKVEAVARLIGSIHDIAIEDTCSIELRLQNTYSTDLKAIGKVACSSENIWIKNSSQLVLRKFHLENGLEIKDEFKSMKIQDLAVMNNGDLLLAIVNSPKIQVVKKDEKELNEFFCFPVPWIGKPQVPVTLHAMKDNRVIVGTVEKAATYGTILEQTARQIIVLSPEKEQLATIDIDQDNRRLFQYPHRIKTNADDDIVFIDKFSNSTGQVTLMTMDKKIKWKYAQMNGDLLNMVPFDPSDLVVTCHNNVIVCDMRNHALCILNSDGHLIKYIKIGGDGVLYPSSIDIDKSGNILVGCETDSESEAKLYSFEKVGFI